MGRMHSGSNQSNVRKPTAVLMVSIAVNLLLAVLVWHVWPSPRPAAPVVATITNLAVVTSRTQPSAASELPTAMFVTNGFHWRQIESTNYDQYAANLRAVGCPEKTVRDIILADVTKHYESLSLASGRQIPYFVGGQQRRLADREGTAKAEALTEEKRALIRRLLGVEWTGDDDPVSRGDVQEHALVRFLLGPMPEETFQRTMMTFGKYTSLKNDMRSRNEGILTDEDEAEVRRLGDAFKQELSNVLTLSQLEEFEARAASFELFGGSLFPEAMDLTPDEARRIGLAKFATQDSFDLFDFGSRPTAAERQARDKEFAKAVAGVLGEERFSEYCRARDNHYVEIYSVCRNNDLSRETMNKVYDIRQLTAEEVVRIREDATLDSSAREKRFREIQDAIQREVSGLMGTKAYSDYLRLYGPWMTNVTKL